MSKRPGDLPGQQLQSAVDKQTALAKEAMEGDIDPGYETVQYNEPLPAAPFSIGNVAERPASIFAGVPVGMGGPGYVPRSFEETRAARSAYDMQIAANRAAAAAVVQAMPPADRARAVVRVDSRTGRPYIATRPLPVEMDPLVQQLSLQTADVVTKINSLYPTLSGKQQVYIKRRLETITHVRKGKHAGDVKTPTSDQLNKVLFRALELHASRRAAQLGAQARRARRERHSLMQRARPIALEDGTTVGTNKRYYKKLASNAVRKVAEQTAQAEAKAVRLQITKINKDRRIAIARAHDRKVNVKDTRPPVQ